MCIRDRIDSAGNMVDSNTVTVNWSASSDCIVFDFEFDDDGTTALVNGQALSSNDEFGDLFTVNGLSGSGLSAAIFDSSATGPNASSSDQDLLVGQGNVLILQEIAGQSTADIFDNPDDDILGGTMTFEFTTPSAPCFVCLLYTSPSPRDQRGSRMPSSA